MPFDVNKFKGAFGLEGARPTLFEATIFGLPDVPGQSDAIRNIRDFTFHCKAAQLPGKTLGMIEVPYFGRKIKVHGDLTFAEWTVTVLNEENFNVRNSFEKWMSSINEHNANIKIDKKYKTPLAFVTQFGKGGLPVKEYTFQGMWCSDITAIEVDWGSNDTIEEFTATLQYDWWESEGTTDSAIF